MTDFWEGMSRTKLIVGTVAAIIALGIAIAGVVVPAVLFWNSNAPLPGRVANIEETLATYDVHHADEQEVFQEVITNQEAFEPQVEQLLKDLTEVRCSRAQRDIERGVRDTVPTICLADWQRR